MSIRITCPSCDASNTVDDEKRGRKVRCRKCDKVIAVPEAGNSKKKSQDDDAFQSGTKVKAKAAGSAKQSGDDDDDRPAKKKKAQAAKKGFPVLVVVGGVAAAVLVLVVGAAAIGGFLLLGKSSPAEPQVKLDVNKQNPDGGNNKVDNPNNNNPIENPQPKQNPNPLVDLNAGKPLPDQMGPEIVARVKAATVYLRVTMTNNQVLEGTGFFTVEPGLIVTNAHVLGMLQANSRLPSQVDVLLHSGEPNESKLAGQVLGVDRANDLAVVRVNGAKQLPEPLMLEEARPPVETQKVYIFGFPFGAQLGKNITVSPSAISSLRKNPAGALEQIQVNGGMHPGNSGGPVVNAFGNVVGVSVAGIHGTQINFAVPAENVRMIMQGRLADARMGEAYLQGDQTRLPVRYTCLDPLSRITQLRVEVWTGTPGQARPHSFQKPQPLAGDGPRQTHAITYKEGAGTLDVPLPPLAPGQVCWLQPVITTANGTQWGPAIATATTLIPVERKPANLSVNFIAQKERSVKLKSSQSVTLFKGKEKKTFADKVELELLEVMNTDPAGGRIRTAYGPVVNVFSDSDGRLVPTSKPVIMLLRQMPPIFMIDPTSKLISHRSERNLSPTLKADLREEVMENFAQVTNSFEAVMIPMPNREVQPAETWQTMVPLPQRVSVAGSAVKKKWEFVDLVLTCNYEGTRTRDQRSEAVITVGGKVQGRGAAAKKVVGNVNGKIAFDLEGGYISFAQLTIGSEYDGLAGEIQAIVIAFDIELNRSAGNPMNVQLSPELKPGPGPGPGPGPNPKGKTLINFNNAQIFPNDLLDPTPKLKPVNARMRSHLHVLQAGKTYVITASSSAFNLYLRVEDTKGKLLAENDGAGKNEPRAITFQPPQNAAYRIIVSGADGKTGGYKLNVQESP